MNAAPALPPVDASLMGSIQLNDGPPSPILPAADARLLGTIAKGATSLEHVTPPPSTALPPADPRLVGLAFRGRDEPPVEHGE